MAHRQRNQGGENGRQRGGGPGRPEKKSRPRRRLFERLQQRVRRIDVHSLSRVDQRDAQAAAVRADVEEIGQLAHLVDLDLEARRAAARGSFALLLRRRGVGRRRQGFRLKAAEVGMVAAGVPAAALAGAARLARRVPGFAKKELGDPLGEPQLADALRAVDQQRMGKPPGPMLERFEQRLVPGVHQRSARWVSMASRTAATSLLASMTRTRAGSALASARYAPLTRSKKARSSRSKRSSGLPEAASLCRATS